MTHTDPEYVWPEPPPRLFIYEWGIWTTDPDGTERQVGSITDSFARDALRAALAANQPVAEERTPSGPCIECGYYRHTEPQEDAERRAVHEAHKPVAEERTPPFHRDPEVPGLPTQFPALRPTAYHIEAIGDDPD